MSKYLRRGCHGDHELSVRSHHGLRHRVRKIPSPSICRCVHYERSVRVARVEQLPLSPAVPPRLGVRLRLFLWRGGRRQHQDSSWFSRLRIVHLPAFFSPVLLVSSLSAVISASSPSLRPV